MKIIKVKKVEGPKGESAICGAYYREKAGMPLLSVQLGEWVICSPDGEPSHGLGENFKVEVVK